MLRTILLISFISLSLVSLSQDRVLETFLSDTSMMHASVSLCIKDIDNGEEIIGFNSGKSLIPASVMKLITSAATLELLGADYTFKTIIGYTGSIGKRTGRLSGNIIIRGGGDPALGSKYFTDHYQDFTGKWIEEIKKTGIRKIDGRVITDDSYYDYLPVPAKWQWEDIGNYYGAGVYGLSVFDNTCEIHFKTSSDCAAVTITGISPKEYKYDFKNRLIAEGTSGEGYVFAAPYSINGWISGTIAANQENFVLNGSIADPPLIIAKIVNDRLEASGIPISEEPATTRLEDKILAGGEVVPLSETLSPPLSEIIEVLNHESVNLFAEHLIKELGKILKNSGSATAGIDVVNDFLLGANINTDGMFIEDGSGLSPLNAINTKELVNLLIYMKNHGKYFPEYYLSFPDAGKEGTLKYCFRDTVFDSRLKAKSGSMTRVRSYAGYFTTNSGRNLAFSIIINNYTGTYQRVISGIEEIIKEIILYK